MKKLLIYLLLCCVSFSGYSQFSSITVVTNTGVLSAPVTQASNITVTSITDVSLTLTWVTGSGGYRLVLMKSGSAVNATPSNNTTYTASTTFGSGSQLGTGNYCVYNGIGTTVTVTGLTANTQYYIQVFEYNDVAGSEKYLTTTATNNPNNEYTFTSEYQAVIAQANTSSYYKPLLRDQKIHNKNIRRMKSDGTWSARDVYYKFLLSFDPHESLSNFAKLNWASPANNTITYGGSPSYRADIGFSTNGTNSYLNTNWLPSNGVQYQLNDASVTLMLSGTTATIQQSNGRDLSVLNSSPVGKNLEMFTRSSSDGTSIRINSTNSGGANAVVPSFHHAYRANSTNQSTYVNDLVGINNSAVSSSAVPSLALTLGSRNNNGTQDAFCARSFASLGLGSSLSTKINDVVDAEYEYLFDLSDTYYQPYELGQIFTDNFARSSIGSNYTQQGSIATWTCNGSALTATGSNLNWGERLVRNYCASWERMEVEAIMQINSTPGAITYGGGIAFSDHNNPDAERTLFVRIDGSTGANAGKLIITQYGGSAADRKISKDAFTVTSGDTYHLYVKTMMFGGYLYMYAKAVNQNGVYVDAIWGAQYIDLWYASADYGFFTIGGNQTFSLLTVKSHERVGAQDLWVGDSITKGFISTASTANDLNARFPNQVSKAKSRTFEISAGSGDITQSVIDKMTGLTAMAPQRVILMIGGNDVGLGIAEATIESHYTSLVTSLKNAGITVVHCLATPRDATNMTTFNSFISSTYGGTDTVIDTFTPLATGTQLNNTYDIGDGIHPNQAGQDLIASTILAAI